MAGLGLEAGEQLGGVLREAGEILGGAELTDEAGGVPRGAAREFAPLEQHDIGDAAHGQVIRDAAPHDAATDDDHAGAPRYLGHGRTCGGAMTSQLRHSLTLVSETIRRTITR